MTGPCRLGRAGRLCSWAHLENEDAGEAVVAEVEILGVVEFAELLEVADVDLDSAGGKLEVFAAVPVREDGFSGAVFTAVGWEEGDDVHRFSRACSSRSMMASPSVGP